MSAAAPARPLLEVRELRVRYARSETTREGADSTAVDGISFSIEAGESLGLVGESGSGKSSIARALLRLAPATGSAVFDGLELLRIRGAALRATRARLQIVFQDPLGALDPRMTVGELVAEPLLEHQRGAAGSHPATVAAMLERVGLGPELLGRYPHQLSGGQAQRVGLARALVLRPQLLICDEPVAALDVSIRSQIANLLREMREALGLALLFIAHDLALVRFLCDRVLVIYRGRLMEMAARDALFDAPRHPYTRALLAAIPAADPAQPPPRSPAPAMRGAGRPAGGGCVYRGCCPLAVERCASVEPQPRRVGASLVSCHRAEELDPWGPAATAAPLLRSRASGPAKR